MSEPRKPDALAGLLTGAVRVVEQFEAAARLAEQAQAKVTAARQRYEDALERLAESVADDLRRAAAATEAALAELDNAAWGLADSIQHNHAEPVAPALPTPAVEQRDPPAEPEPEEFEAEDEDAQPLTPAERFAFEPPQIHDDIAETEEVPASVPEVASVCVNGNGKAKRKKGGKRS